MDHRFEVLLLAGERFNQVDYDELPLHPMIVRPFGNFHFVVDDSSRCVLTVSVDDSGYGLFQVLLLRYGA